MPLPTRDHPILLIADGNPAVDTMLQELLERGIGVDRASDVTQARATFFARGGHRVLVFAGDLAPTTAQRVVDALRDLDPSLPIVVFGNDLLRQTAFSGVTRVTFHPGSRAGVGAVVKALRSC